MAVDTRAKRLSMLNMGTGDLLPDPNVSGVDQSERQTFLDSYSGILWTAVGPVLDNAKFSLLSYQQPFNSPIPAPVGGALTQGDNQHLMWQYAGINWIAVGVTIMAQARSTSRRVFSRVFGRVN